MCIKCLLKILHRCQSQNFFFFLSLTVGQNNRVFNALDNSSQPSLIFAGKDMSLTWKEYLKGVPLA
jgi:hypothetical protein